MRNRAKHAAIFEYGTGPRHWASGKSTGRMPAGRVFIPIAMQRRRIMLASDLLRAGLVASFVLVATLERLPILVVLASLEATVGVFFGPAGGGADTDSAPQEVRQALSP